MQDRIIEKLGAYLDGELDLRTRDEVESHLQFCADCRLELEELRNLSLHLQTTPQPDFPTAANFRDRVMLSIPRNSETPGARTNDSFLLWLIPVFVLVSWIFLQVVMSMMSAGSFINLGGMTAGLTGLGSSTTQNTPWFTLLQLLSNGSGEWGNLDLFNNIGVFAHNLLLQMILQVAVVGIYTGLLILIWRNKNKGTLNSQIHA